jgi:hypothetical protein
MALILNESPYFDLLEEALDGGFNVVMFSDQSKSYQELMTDLGFAK